jgi:hypothetical protein
MDEKPDDGNWFDMELTQNAVPQDIPQHDNFEDELTQFTNEVTTINDIGITPELGLEDLDPESPEYRNSSLSSLVDSGRRLSDPLLLRS